MLRGRHIQRSIRLAQRYGFGDIRVYVLYNFEDDNDTPEYFYYRIKEINKLGALAYPMRFRTLNSANGQYVSRKWDRDRFSFRPIIEVTDYL